MIRTCQTFPKKRPKEKKNLTGKMRGAKSIGVLVAAVCHLIEKSLTIFKRDGDTKRNFAVRETARDTCREAHVPMGDQRRSSWIQEQKQL